MKLHFIRGLFRAGEVRALHVETAEQHADMLAKPLWRNKFMLHHAALINLSWGMLTYDSITVSSTWELTSVSMRYSQGEGVNTSLSRITYCTHVVVYDCLLFSCVRFLYVCGYLPWQGHVLPRTLIIKVMCVNEIYLQG